MFINILRNKHFQFVLLIIAGCYFIYLSIRTIDVVDLWQQIQLGKYWITLPVMCISLVGYYFRSLRWKLILQNMEEENVPLTSLYASLSIGYAVNFATPRLGEISRCLVLNKSAGVPVDRALISVFIERVADIVCLALIVATASWLSIGTLQVFVTQQILIPLRNSILNKPWFVIFFICLAALGLLYWGYQKMNTHARVRVWMNRLGNAFKSVFSMQQKKYFLLYTICIWSCYFLMTYLWFGVFTETADLGIREAFIIMAVGSVGRSVPIQGGGMGAYHYLVSNVFVIFGVSLLTGNAMAFVIHGAQMILTIFLGIIAWIWLLYTSEK